MMIDQFNFIVVLFFELKIRNLKCLFMFGLEQLSNNIDFIVTHIFQFISNFW